MKKNIIISLIVMLIAAMSIPTIVSAEGSSGEQNSLVPASDNSKTQSSSAESQNISNEQDLNNQGSEDDEYFKGVWVSTIYGLDFPSTATTDSEALKSDIDKLIDECKSLGFNNIFLQVSPCSDAIYPSEILPWSKYLTGEQGLAPENDFDPLAYWVEKCHENSLKIHAWINPYRVTKSSSDYENLSEDHPAVKNPSWVVKYSDGNYYYDPAIPEVRQLICSVVNEILENYDVDGIHMDDYFYPGTDFNDSESYAKYNNGQFTNIADWRRENVNMMVRDVAKTVDSVKPEASFGISPCGIWENKGNDSRGSDTRGRASYSQLYADSLSWVKNNWIDYIVPQIYWSFGTSASDYQVLTDWWADAVSGTNVKLYIGLADYRSNDVKSTSVWYNGAEIKKQMEYNGKKDGVSGEVHFRIGTITQNSALMNVISTQYNGEPESISVYLNGQKIVFDQEPVLQNDRTLVPMRKIFEAFGFDVEWDNELREVTATRSDDIVKMKVGESYFTLNGTKYETDVPVTIIGDRTMIPLRALSESLSCDVQWDGSQKKVTITK